MLYGYMRGCAAWPGRFAANPLFAVDLMLATVGLVCDQWTNEIYTVIADQFADGLQEWS